MRVKVITHGFSAERIIHFCDGNDMLADVCKKYVPMERHYGVTIRYQVNGDIYKEDEYEFNQQRLCDEGDVVWIAPYFRTGDMWRQDDDGVYRYIGACV